MQVIQKQVADSGQRTWSIDWHPQGKALISSGSNKTVTIWSYQQQKLQKQSTIQTEHTKTIRSVKFSHKGDKIAVGSFDSTISVWVYKNQSQEYEMLSTLQGHENQVKCVSWSGNDNKIASCSRDKNIWIWDFDPISYDYTCDSVLQGHTQDVKYIDWFPGNQQNKLISASYDNTIRIWQREDDDYVCEQVLQGHQSIVWNVQIADNLIFSVSQDCSIIQWQLKKQKSKYQLVRIYSGMHSLPIYTLCIYEKYLISGGADNSICFTQIAQEKEQRTIKGTIVSKVSHQSDINCLKLHPKDKNILASCSDDETIRIWKLQTK